MSGHSLPGESFMEAEWEIPDPGTGKAINLQQSGTICFVTGASGETNTLPNPTRVGQRLGLFCRTDGGGNRVVTVAGPINQNANNTITFADVNDFILLESVRTALNTFRWRVVANDGAALSTV